MSARLSPDEQRDAKVRELIPAHAATIRAQVERGEPPLALIADRWTSVLADDALAQQVALAALTDPAMAGHMVRQQIEALISAQAEVEVKKVVAQMERDRQESADAARIERAVYDQNMGIFGYGGMG